MDIYEEIVRLNKLGRSSALATIVECKGSSPQKQGAKMLVRDDGSALGTLGGGCLEADVVQHALMALKDGQPRTVPFELTEKDGGLVCGGTLLVYIEPVLVDPRLVILGAGHVGKSLATLARFAGFHVIVADDRPEHANRDGVPDALTGQSFAIPYTGGADPDYLAFDLAASFDVAQEILAGKVRGRVVVDVHR